MKIFFTLLVLLPLFSGADVPVFHQEGRITLSVEQVPLKTVFEAIEEQASVRLMYDLSVVNDKEKVSLSVRNSTVEDLLKLLFRGKSLEWSQKGNIIRLSRAQGATGSKRSTSPPTQDTVITVTGTVRDENGDPLPGVTVAVPGTNMGTATDPAGRYSLVVAKGAEILFSFIGYITRSVTVSDMPVIDVMLSVDMTSLEEVVVVGYGTQKIVNLTGSVSAVDGEVLARKAATGSMDALQGVLPGTTISRRSGSPGQEDFNIRIRGVTSVNDNSVLVLIDGIEGRLEEVRPEDIESVSVLKDAAAASIYGAKAAGGVVLVTTKRGKSGKIRAEYNAFYSLSDIARMPERLSSYEAGVMKNLSMTNAGASPAVSQEILNKLKDPGRALYEIDPASPNTWIYYGDYDYEDLVLKEFAPQQSHNIAVSGGSENTTFRLSGTYFKNDGIIKIGYDKNERYSGRLNIDTKIGKYLKLSNIISYSRNLVEKPGGRGIEGPFELLSEVFTRSGVTPLRDPNGNWVIGRYLGSWDARSKLAQWSYDAGIDKKDQNNLRLNSTLAIENLVKGLRVRIVGVTDASFDNSFVNKNPITEFGVDGSQTGFVYSGNNVFKDQTKSNFKEFQSLVDYDLAINKHTFHVLGGYSWQEYRLEYFSGQASELINGNLPDFEWASPAGLILKDHVNTNAFQSAFGRFNYNFDERYLFEVNVRYDGSSKLSPLDRYRLFPSFSAGWRINEEDWFNVAFIDQLKVRGSWGQLGNAGVLGNYGFIPNLSIKDDLVLGLGEQKAQYVYQGTLASKNISWETVETSNIGIDIGFLNNRLSLTADYFVKRNKDMLARISLPSVIGIGVPNMNVGELKAWGWEANVAWENYNNKFSYWINANISDAKNKLIRYEGADVIREGTVNLLNGYPVNSIFGYKSDGLFQSEVEVENHVFQDNRTGAGDVKYINLNGDERISPGEQTKENHGDLVYLGNVAPRYTFGLQFGFIKNAFDFSLFLQGVGKRTFLMDQFSMLPFSHPSNNPQKHHLDYWREDNPDAYWPRPYNSGGHNFKPSDRWIQDAAYIRLKDIQVGYTLPSEFIARAGIDRLRIYLAGRDIWEITKTFDFIDPESPNGATFVYPFRRKYTLGVNLTF